MTADLHPKLAKARAMLVLQQPFFGVLALHLKPVQWDKGTLATDGTSLFWDCGFVDSKSLRDLVFIWAHEVLHNAYKHHTRRQGREHELWNKAADYAINGFLVECGFTMPDGGLHDPQFRGLSAESIYKILDSQQGKPGQGAPQSGQGNQPGPGKPGPGKPGSDPGQCGAVLDAAPGHDPAALAKAEAEADSRVRAAVAVAKARGAGKIPGELARLVESMSKPRIDWRGLLRRFVDESASRDFSFMRPNRRHIAAGFYFPGYVPDRPSHIVAIMDTSASVSDADLSAFVAELQAVLDEGAADKITVAYADTRVNSSQEFSGGDIVRADVMPRGGTSFVQPLAWLGENIPDASAVIYMTDCDCGGEWGEEPAAPLLWIVTGDPRNARRYSAAAPFGEAVILAE